MNFPNLDLWGERADNLCKAMDELTKGLHAFKQSDQQPSPQMHAWEEFVIVDAVTLTSGVGSLGGAGGHVPAPNGWEGFVERITLLVGGSSSAAVGGVFRGGPSTQTCIDIVPLVMPVIINTVTFYGNAANYASPAYFRDGASIQVTVTGADTTAGTQAALRVEGKRRQVVA